MRVHAEGREDVEITQGMMPRMSKGQKGTSVTGTECRKGRDECTDVAGTRFF